MSQGLTYMVLPGFYRLMGHGTAMTPILTP